jgi:hypothetical protein
LGVFDWFLVIIVSSFPLWAMEVFKKVRKSISVRHTDGG